MQKAAQPLLGTKDLRIAENAFKIIREVKEASQRGQKRFRSCWGI
jgi:hypothetical protein